MSELDFYYYGLSLIVDCIIPTSSSVTVSTWPSPPSPPDDHPQAATHRRPPPTAPAAPPCRARIPRDEADAAHSARMHDMWPAVRVWHRGVTLMSHHPSPSFHTIPRATDRHVVPHIHERHATGVERGQREIVAETEWCAGECENVCASEWVSA